MSIERIQKKSGIIGRSDSIQQVLEMIMQVSPVDISVLITGESGTGKEMIAKALHQNSKRSHESLVTVNCGNNGVFYGTPAKKIRSRRKNDIYI